MPDVTVSPTTQTLTVNAGAVTISNPVFGTQATTAFEMFTHCLDAGGFKVKTGTNSTPQGTVVFNEEFAAMEYGEVTGRAIGIANLSTVSPSAYNAIAELTAVADTNTAINGSFSLGFGDIVFRARVKIDTSATYTTSGMRYAVGLYRFHSEATGGGTSGVSSGNPYEISVCWIKNRDAATWQAMVSYQTVDENEDILYHTHFESTNVPIDEWVELRIDIPQNGSQATFIADGVVKATITRTEAGSAFPPVYGDSPGYRWNPSVGVRDARISGENATNKAGLIQADYIHFRYETNYF